MHQLVRLGAAIAIGCSATLSLAQEAKPAAKSTAAPAAQPAPAATAKAAPAKAAPAKAKTDTLVIIGRIIEIPGKFPPNDLYNYVYIMKYRVVKVVKGAYEGKEILVGEYNPLIPRSQIKDKMDKFVDGDVQKFEIGAKHKLVLLSPIGSVWTEAIEDEYFDSDMQKYYALRTDASAE
jgi:hypothetical protein